MIVDLPVFPQDMSIIMIIAWRKQSSFRLFSPPNDAFGGEWIQKENERGIRHETLHARQGVQRR
ncbi:MAG: hypothetical protein IKS25_00525, partial [Oscillospiraceae bacterium]|nr:hypothetical protein [Oscillospiraceae bacterium]